MARSSPALRAQQLPSNAEIAATLERIAALLEQQQANPYRIQAYRTAAGSIRTESRSVAELALQEGPEGLEQLYGVGPRISRHIDTLVHSGRIPLLEQLEGEINPEGLLTSVPGIGPKSAQEIYQSLGVNSLEDLELAAHDGRLEQLPGFGPRRIAGLRHTLGNMLSRRRGRPRAAPAPQERPPVPLLLELDAEYRQKAKADHLPKLAPRRFNPEGAAWLPILHTEREGWSFAIAYSNTARAHQQQRTQDWVVIYYEHDGILGQYTVVTEPSGPLRGRRVVRGRESECLRYYGVSKSGPTLGSGSQHPPAPV